MANIRVDVNYTIKDGAEIVFRSPVDCSAITGLIVYYPGEDGNTTSKVFALADAHANNVGDIDYLFAENVVVKVILDVTAGMAYVQNADTNAYLEGRFAEITDLINNGGGGSGTAGKFDLPTFDLAAMGLAAITPDGPAVLITSLDLTETVAAMEAGPVKFSFLLNAGQEITMTAVANATAIPSEGLYQWVIHGELNGTILTGYFQFAVSSGTIKAWATTGSGSLLDAEGVLF